MIKFFKRVYSLDRFFFCTRLSGNSNCKAHNSLVMECNTSKRGPKSRLSKEGGCNGHPSDMDFIKEKFAKLLLGEDMPGSGKGVSSALALSNAITNLAASVFGEQRRLEPMSAERKARWRKEID